MLYCATCKMGLESTVTRQLKDLGITVEKTEDARVVFSGDEKTLFTALLWLRTAERVLMIVSEFNAVTFDELFEGTKAIEWKRYLLPDSNIHVNGKSAKSTLFSVSDCQRIVKKAIVDNLLAAYHRVSLPETGKEVIVEVGLLRDRVTIALDACGAGLSRRGYRTYNVAAPISETLGAAIVMLSRYYPDKPFIDPMCGSGTMPIEAAMIAKNMAPGLNRSFAAENWHFVSPKVVTDVRLEARGAVRDIPVDILGSDIDPRCIELSKKHAKKAGVMVNWAVLPVKDLKPEKRNGVICCNPPYGERLLEKREVESIYRDMATAFKPLTDWSINIVSGFQGFEWAYGKHADKTRKLSNGGMNCRLYQYFAKRDAREKN